MRAWHGSAGRTRPAAWTPSVHCCACAAREHGQTLFNEAAFDRGEALYDGSLLGMPYRAVVKTFQVAVWRELCADWRSLAESERVTLQRRMPPIGDMVFDGGAA